MRRLFVWDGGGGGWALDVRTSGIEGAAAVAQHWGVSAGLGVAFLLGESGQW